MLRRALLRIAHGHGQTAHDVMLVLIALFMDIGQQLKQRLPECFCLTCLLVLCRYQYVAIKLNCHCIWLNCHCIWAGRFDSAITCA